MGVASHRSFPSGDNPEAKRESLSCRWYLWTKQLNTYVLIWSRLDNCKYKHMNMFIFIYTFIHFIQIDKYIYIWNMDPHRDHIYIYISFEISLNFFVDTVEFLCLCSNSLAPTFPRHLPNEVDVFVGLFGGWIRLHSGVSLFSFNLKQMSLPIPSMYGIYIYIHTYIWLIFMVNVGKYTIHGWYGLWHFKEVGLLQPTSWGWHFLPLFTRFYTSLVVRDFFHQQYGQECLLNVTSCFCCWSLLLVWSSHECRVRFSFC